MPSLIPALLAGLALAPPPVDTPPTRKPRVAPPQAAFQVGLMPLASTGVTAFRLAHPSYDGRGVLIAVLDGGVDPAVPGLLTTSLGDAKVLDTRDFSGENDIALTRVSLEADGCAQIPAGPRLCGATTLVQAADAGQPCYGGVLRELPLGNPPFADLNDDGSNRDAFGVLVVRRQGEWVAWVDANGDGSLADEQGISDYLVRRQSFTFTTPQGPRGAGLVTAVVNLDGGQDGNPPHLAIALGGDHGTHVAGIAAGHSIYGVGGFDGVAPGAQLVSLKISNNARGGVSTTGSMLRAMTYAYGFAQQRHLPLVINMSFGVGNANESRAAMDSIVDAFLIAHPDVFFAIASGNDGPGTSTLGEPGSSELAVSVGAAYSAPFAQLQFGAGGDFMGWWSSRGGEIVKPDLVAPGVAYSTVPAWDQGGEVKGGTSMATPYVSGLAAVLISAMLQEHLPASSAAVLQALRAGARPFPGESVIDQGPGLAQVEPAYQYLRSGHEAPRFRVEALAPMPPGPANLAPVAPTGSARGAAQRSDVAALQRGRLSPGAYRRQGLASRADTIQRFRVSLVPDADVARRTRTYRLVSDAAWVRPTSPTVIVDSVTGSALIEVRYDASALTRPGRYVGAVRAIGVPDSSAAPAFVLASTVVVADSAFIVRAVRAAPGSATRYFLRVPTATSGLTFVLTTPDSSMQGNLNLYEPTGRPARGEKSADFGAENGRTARLNEAAEDVVPGVYEMVVQAMPGRAITYDLIARRTPIRVLGIDSGVAEALVRLDVAADTTVGATLDLVGAARTWNAQIEHSGPYRLEAVAPAWAKRAVAEVEVAPEIWDQVTDFGITVYDSVGAQLGNGAMNYPYHRVSADLPEGRPASYRITVELAPGFARPDPPATTAARVRVRFEGEPRTLVTLPWLRRGSSRLRLPSFAPLAAGDGFEPLLRLTVGAGASDKTAMTQLFTLPARP